MSSLPVIVFISLTLFTWAVAIWASVGEEQEPPEDRPPKEEERVEEPKAKQERRKAA